MADNTSTESTLGLSPLLTDLVARGLIHTSTDLGALDRHLTEGPVTFYCGFDPTGPSLHAGHLQQLMLMVRFAAAGHIPIVLVGGATARIGDPSGRDTERPMLDESTIVENTVAIRTQIEQFIGTGLLVDNYGWSAQINLLDFLRDVGKHANVADMLAKDSVQSRRERSEGVSFTEFTYQLLQANDFAHLHRTHGCDLQIAGSDQWGNITAGIDLARRRHGVTLHGLTSPLMVRSDGQKFGKSTGGAIWLSPDDTSPFAFFQHWMQLSDADVEPMLLRLSLRAVEDIQQIVADHQAAPHRRDGQRTLAHDLTTIVHGEAAARSAAAASAVLFSGTPADLDAGALGMLATELGTTTVTDEALGTGVDLVELFVSTGLGKSKGAVRKNAAGFRVNGITADLTRPLTTNDFGDARAVLLSHGKRTHHLLVHI